jgi:superfamily I DNA/RNA helicase
LLAYLQLVDNPHFVAAFKRIVNIPPRRIGEKGGFSSFLPLNFISLIYYADT